MLLFNLFILEKNANQFISLVKGEVTVKRESFNLAFRS